MSNITQAHCNTCGQLTNHDIIAERDTGPEDGSYIYKFEMLECRGCESVSMRKSAGEPERELEISSYPPALDRRTPEWVSPLSLFTDPHVSPQIILLMREVYTAIQNGSYRLATMGVRAVLEIMMIEKIGDRRTFKEKVDAFQQAGYLSLRQAMNLHSILDAGHAAIHRGWDPTDKDVGTLLDITESIIATVYLHEDLVRHLDDEVPKRRKPNPPSMPD
jgi:hypothetical protein